MSERITFTSVELLSFSRTATGGKAQFSASLTQSVSKAMGWTDVPEFLTGGSPEGDLAATVIELVPNDVPLKRHRIDLNVSRMKKFEFVRRELEGKKGKGHRQELRFEVLFTDVKGARKLEEYIQTCGKSSLIVSYEKQATQTTLPMTADSDQDTLPGVQ